MRRAAPQKSAAQRTSREQSAAKSRSGDDADQAPLKLFRVMLERPEGSQTMTCFRVPPTIMAAFAPRLRVPVTVTINGFSWRTTIAPYGSEFYVGLRAEVRKAIRADAGEAVTVAMQRDTAVRRVDVPADLSRALAKSGARERFDRLSFSHQKEFVNSVGDAKRPDTRKRRIEAIVATVLANRKS
jgi:hypothetical protein